MLQHRRARASTIVAGGLACACPIAGARPCVAEDASAGAGAESGGGKGRVIEEIVVTAQKTAQNIQEVPVSITAIEGDFVRQAALTDLVDIVQYAPNVQFYES